MRWQRTCSKVWADILSSPPFPHTNIVLQQLRSGISLAVLPFAGGSRGSDRESKKAVLNKLVPLLQEGQLAVRYVMPIENYAWYCKVVPTCIALA